MCQTSNNDNSYSINSCSYGCHCRISHINYDQLWQDTNKREQLIHNDGICKKFKLRLSRIIEVTQCSSVLLSFLCANAVARVPSGVPTGSLPAKPIGKGEIRRWMSQPFAHPELKRVFTKDSPGVRWSKSINDRGRLSLNFNSFLLLIAQCNTKLRYKTWISCQFPGMYVEDRWWQYHDNHENEIDEHLFVCVCWVASKSPWQLQQQVVAWCLRRGPWVGRCWSVSCPTGRVGGHPLIKMGLRIVGMLERLKS